MRNEHLVPFFFYIGLISGNIVPTSITKITNDQKTSKDLNKINLAMTDTTISLHCDEKTKTTIKFDLEDYRNTIKDSEILSQGGESPNNINGRSFIFIRQKFKSPMLNLFRSQMLNPNDISHETAKSVMASIDNDKFEELSRRFSTLNVASPAKDNLAVEKISTGFDKNQGNLLNQLCYSRLKLENDGMINKIKEKIKVQDVDKVASEHREYLELLKPPLLPQNYKEDDGKLVLQENEKQIVDASKVTPFQASYVRNQDSFAKISLDLRQSLAKKYNKDTRPYQPKSFYSKNELPLQQHEVRDGSYMEDNISHNILVYTKNEENTDNYKSLEKYFKNTVEGKMRDKKKPSHVNRIHYCHDCPLKNIHNDAYQRKRVEADCKCGRHVYLKGRSEWEEQEKQKETYSFLPTERQLITMRPGGKESKEDKAMVDLAIARNQQLY